MEAEITRTDTSFGDERVASAVLGHAVRHVEGSDGELPSRVEASARVADIIGLDPQHALVQDRVVVDDQLIMVLSWTPLQPATHGDVMSSILDVEGSHSYSEDQD